MNDIVFEKDNSNDAEGIVVSILCESGAEVRQGQRICDVETSKVVVELRAPAAGVLCHALSVGQIVKAGSSVGQIRSSVSDPDMPISGATMLQRESTEEPRHFSTAARDLLSQLNGNPTEFISRFVTEDDVRKRYLPISESAVIARAGAFPDARLEELASHKQEEMRILGRGAGATFLSVIGVSLVPFEIFRKGAGFFERKVLDLVVSCVAKLLISHPKLNASYLDGQILYHGTTNIGVAFDGGEKLLVYNVRNADTLNIRDVGAEIIAGYRKYVAGELTPSDVTGISCTISDLSGGGVDFVFPLLPEGQSCIIGISNAPGGGFRLYAGFDHRLSTGQEVSQFLLRLSQDVRALLREACLPKCYYCGKGPIASGDTEILMTGVRANGDGVVICKRCWK